MGGGGGAASRACLTQRQGRGEVAGGQAGMSGGRAGGTLTGGDSWLSLEHK